VRFLIDADLPRSATARVEQYGHQAVNVRDIGLGRARDPDIAAYARQQRMTLLAGDFDYADVRIYPPEEYAGIVILELGRQNASAFVLRLLDELLQQADVVAKLEGRLAIVRPGRIRLRPP
jgi:predicted nuclease of predicted toxin-antitoxin system